MNHKIRRDAEALQCGKQHRRPAIMIITLSLIVGRMRVVVHIAVLARHRHDSDFNRWIDRFHGGVIITETHRIGPRIMG